MAAVEIFSSSVNYKYKSKTLSLSFFVVLTFIVLSLVTPLFLIYNAGGIWRKNRLHIETSNIRFAYKYFMLIEENIYSRPIVCTTFTEYKENTISDDCILVKVQEIDTNIDGKKDIFKFDIYFYTSKPLKSVKLLLFFNFKFQELFEATVESLVIFQHALDYEVQKLMFTGDLILQQRNLIKNDGIYNIANHSISLINYTLSDLLSPTFHDKFSAEVINRQITWQSGYSSEEPVTVHVEMFYKEHSIHYQPSLSEELKWAWIQYVSTLLVFVFIAKHILVFLFTNKYLNTYIVVPWKSE